MSKISHLLVAGASALALTLTGVAASPAIAAPNAPQSKAAAWLADQVPGGTHLFESRYGPGAGDVFVDYGLNLDLQYALRELGDTTTADQVYDAVLANAEEYTDSFGTRYAGSVGKLATYVALNGDDATNLDGRDLIADLKALMVTDGAEEGRFKDAPDGEYQSANTVGQSWGVRALDAVGDADTATAADFLIDQQCSDGGFRLYQVDDSCESAVDATAFSVLALDEVGGHDAVVDDAVDWLLSQQAADGSFEDAANPNSNSTGLAARVFSAHGHPAEAKQAALWIETVQLTAGPDAGGIASIAADAVGTGSSAIDPLDLDKFVRATVQAVLGLDSWEAPGPVATLTLKPSTTKPKQGDTLVVTAQGADADGRTVGDVSDDITLESSVASDTIDGNKVTFNHASPHVLTATHVPTGTTATITVQVTPESSSTGGGSGSGSGSGSANGTGAAAPGNGSASLPNAGADVESWQPIAAVLMVLAGSALVLTARRRRVGAHV